MMTAPNDLVYFERRESRSRALAAASEDVSVRIAHLRMADGYAARIVALKPVVAAAPMAISALV